MPSPARVSDADISDAIRRYLAGEGRLMSIAVSIGIGVPRLKREMSARGVTWKTPADTLADRQKRLKTDLKWKQKLSDNAKRVAEVWGKSDENRNRMRELGKRRRGATQTPTETHLDRRSAAHEQRLHKLSPSAVTLNEWLKSLGAVTTLEKAVGRYNVDISVGTVAVEVHRYSFNPLGESASAVRLKKRADYLRNRGWVVCYIWIGMKGQWLTTAAAEYIMSLAKRAESDPSVRSCYWVIRGSGEVVTGGGSDSNQGA